MPIYAYTAIDPASNKASQGKIEADSLTEARRIIRSQGQMPTSLEEQAQTSTVGTLFGQIPVVGQLLVPRIGLKDLNIMTQQMYTLLNAGIPLIEAIYLLEQQAENKKLKSTLKEIRANVMAGDSFSSALGRFHQDFSRLYVNMVRAGEVSGNLDMTIHRLGALLEKNLILRNKLTQAMLYPIVTLLVVFGVIVVIMTVVVPQFKNLFSSYGAALPLPTQVLMDLSNFMTSFWWALLAALVGGLYWFNLFRVGPGKPMVDQWLLTLPLIGNVVLKMYVSRFVRTLATVVSSGVALTEALATTATTIDNFVLRTGFERAKESIIAGGTLSKPLEQSGFFPVMVTKMIAVGEETGKLDDMMFKAADFLDQEVDRSVDTMTTLIEPIMIVILGGIILAVALALYIPLFDAPNVIAGSH